MRDMGVKGAIHYHRGDTLEEILQKAGGAVVNEVAADIGAIMREIGVDLLHGLTSMVSGQLTSFAASVIGRFGGGK